MSKSNVLLPITVLAPGSMPGAEGAAASVLNTQAACAEAVALGMATTSGTMADPFAKHAPDPLVTVLHSVE